MEKISKRLEIQNKLGLHARAAALLVQTVKRFAADVRISKDGQTVDGRSILGLLTLEAAQGSKIEVEAAGKEAAAALRAIESLLDRRFHEVE